MTFFMENMTCALKINSIHGVSARVFNSEMSFVL